ncbi:polyketide synthase [Candidatus Magnetomorum sp. HK-1]|nr:polyketide synthase [Candidatus Magnetomorum sp. HK-1]
MNTKKKYDIAIIGMACRFPEANNYNEFWNNLKKGVNSIKEMPSERWDVNTYYSTDINIPGKSISKWCGLIDSFDSFDNEFFNMSPREVELMDPQQRLLLEETWHCMEDSSVSLEELQKKRTSVYIGVMALDSLNLSGDSNIQTDSYSALGNYSGILANRISYSLGLSGDSYSIDAACASSLVAAHQARQSLLRGQADYAFAGSVSLNFHPFKYISFSKARMLSPDGQCKTFDKDANGYVPGDGIAVLLLRRLSDAIQSGNHIYGLIKGSAVNYTGSKLMITAPRVGAQSDVISSAYEDANISPGSVTYVEAHGTGTSLGDPIEVEALTRVFQQHTHKKNFCKLGSVKTNIGHTEAVAGMAGLIKVLLMMNHREIPPSLNFKTINPVINLDNSPFSISVKQSKWESPILRAGVSSFGMGGVNSHFVLEEFPKKQLPQKKVKQPELFILSAKTEKSLIKMIEQWRRFAQSDTYNNYSLEDICATLATGRNTFSYRLGFIVNTHDELIKQINKSPEIFSKHKNVHFCLRIGEYPLKNRKRFLSFLKESSLFNKEIDLIETSLHQIGFQNNQFHKETIDHFIGAYVFLNVFLKTGQLVPNIVTGNPKNSGLMTALTISGMLKFEDSLLLLSGKKKYTDIAFNRPKIPFLDPVSQKILTTFHFDSDYIQGLIDKLYISTEAIDFYFDKTKSLLENQFTFKKYLQEWDAVLKKSGNDTHQILWRTAEISEKERKLFAIIAANSIRKLNRKWNLSEKPIDASTEFFEIVDLLTDNVMPKEITVTLFRNEKKDLKTVANILNKNQKQLDIKNPYKILKNKPFNGTGHAKKWFDSVKHRQIVNPQNILCLDFGDLPQIDTENHLFFEDISNRPEIILKKNILQLWLKGVHVDLKKLYPEGSFQKVPLPVYPFNGSRYSLPKIKRRPDVHDFVKKLHPLLHKNTSDLSGHRFHSIFTGNEYFFSDHMINGNQILPGVAYIEMARSAAAILAAKPVYTLKDIVWIRPIQVEKNDQNVNISIKVEANNLKFEISMPSDSQPNICSQGKILYQTHEFTKTTKDKIDIQSIAKRCLQTKNKLQCYDLFKKFGFGYGKGFQAVENMSFNETETLSYLKLPIHLQDSFDDFVLHPTLMDSALHGVIFLLHHWESSTQTSIPFTLGEINSYKQLPKACYSYVQLTGTGRLKKFSILLTDLSGNVCVQMNNFTMRPVVHDNKAQLKTGTSSEVLYFENIWESTDIDTNQKYINTPLLIFDTDKKLLNELKKQLNSDEIVLVRPGREFTIVGHQEYIIRAKTQSDYQMLIQQLSEKNSLPVNVIFTWSKCCSGIEMIPTKKESIDEQLHFSIYPAFYFCKALMKQKPESTIKLLNIFDRQNPFQAAISGFARSMKLENPKFSYKTVSAENIYDIESTTKKVLFELNIDDLEPEVRYTNENRQVNIFKPLDSHENTPTPILIKENGVYLITGGLGGLGLIFAELLSKNHKVNLILTGRSQLSLKKKTILDKIRSSGSQVKYIMADASESKEVNKLITQVKNEFMQINGLIHSAGIIKNDYILNKTPEQMNQVFAPKIYSTIYLDDALSTEKLDFFVLFSSISGILGDIGLSDYAYANRFLDYFTYYREDLRKHKKRFGKTLSINWPLWKDGGMQIDEQSKKRLYLSLGMKELQTSNGIQAFIKGLSIKQSQFIVMEGNSDRIKQALKIDHKDHHKPLQSNVEKAHSDTNVLLHHVQKDLTQIASDILKTNNPMDLNKDLIKYGFDSITLTEFTNIINETYHLDMTPAIFFEYTTLKSFIEHLIKAYNDKLSMYYRDIETDDNEMITSEVDDWEEGVL